MISSDATCLILVRSSRCDSFSARNRSDGNDIIIVVARQGKKKPDSRQKKFKNKLFNEMQSGFISSGSRNNHDGDYFGVTQVVVPGAISSNPIGNQVVSHSYSKNHLNICH